MLDIDNGSDILRVCKVYFTHMGETIENRIDFYRKKIGVTQEALALSVGVTRQTIIALEKGNYVPSVLLALKIAQFFKEPVEKVFKVKL